MRHLTLIAAAMFLACLAGCKHSHSHGICDCELDDHCSSRSPWIRYSPALDPPVETAPAPAKALPAVPKKDL